MKLIVVPTILIIGAAVWIFQSLFAVGAPVPITDSAMLAAISGSSGPADCQCYTDGGLCATAGVPPPKCPTKAAPAGEKGTKCDPNNYKSNVYLNPEKDAVCKGSTPENKCDLGDEPEFRNLVKCADERKYQCFEFQDGQGTWHCDYAWLGDATDANGRITGWENACP